MSLPDCTVRLADLHAEPDQAELVRLLNHYAEHPMGDGRPLPTTVQQAVVEGLQAHPMALVFLAERDRRAIGMAVCFVGFSTFQAKPLINIHDLIVEARFRGQGIGGQLLDSIADYAQARQWCAITLEVRADNPARQLYAAKGFSDLSLPTHSGTMLFGKRNLLVTGAE